MLDSVKNALGITTDDPRIVNEIRELIESALVDLQIAGIQSDLGNDPLIMQAVKTYCRAHFRSPSDYDRLKASYDEQKAQLMVATGYTKWRESCGSR